MTVRVGGIGGGGKERERGKDLRGEGKREREGEIFNNFKFYRLQKEYLF